LNSAALASAILLLATAALARPPRDVRRAAEVMSASWFLGTDEDPAELSRRVLEVSGRFLGTPYVHSPLGEGAGVDPDPTIRFDAVDCLTFVEETLALSIARNPAEVPALLQQLRYARNARYEERNHLVEAQWLPNNLRKGFVRDITRGFGGAATVRARKRITAESWASPSSRLLNLPKASRVTGSFDLDMLPLSVALAGAPRIPPGTILLVVRADHPRKVTRVTHLGFVVQKKNRTYLRHAARSGYHRVVDEELATFLTRNARYGKWPVAGIALLEPGKVASASSDAP
jgi:hypothetical protein